MMAPGMLGVPPHMPRPPRASETFRPGDWNCPGCRSHNFATRMECRRCKIPKPSLGLPKMLEGPGGLAAGGRGDPKKTQRWPIFVGNISFDTREEEVADILRSCEGLITFQLAMNPDGSGSRGYGFAEFESPELAREAMKKRDGTEVRGRSLRLRWGQSAPHPELGKDGKEGEPQASTPALEGAGIDKVIVDSRQFDGGTEEEKQRNAYTAVLGPKASHVCWMMKETGCRLQLRGGAERTSLPTGPKEPLHVVVKPGIGKDTVTAEQFAMVQRIIEEIVKHGRPQDMEVPAIAAPAPAAQAPVPSAGGVDVSQATAEASAADAGHQSRSPQRRSEKRSRSRRSRGRRRRREQKSRSRSRSRRGRGSRSQSRDHKERARSKSAEKKQALAAVDSSSPGVWRPPVQAPDGRGEAAGEGGDAGAGGDGAASEGGAWRPPTDALAATPWRPPATEPAEPAEKGGSLDVAPKPAEASMLSIEDAAAPDTKKAPEEDGPAWSTKPCGESWTVDPSLRYSQGGYGPSSSWGAPPGWRPPGPPPQAFDAAYRLAQFAPPSGASMAGAWGPPPGHPAPCGHMHFGPCGYAPGGYAPPSGPYGMFPSACGGPAPGQAPAGGPPGMPPPGGPLGMPPPAAALAMPPTSWIGPVPPRGADGGWPPH